MGTPTFDVIAETTLTSASASVTFSSLNTLAAGYRDLIVMVDLTSTSNVQVRSRINGDSGSNYQFVEMEGDGSSASGGFGARTQIDCNDSTVQSGHSYNCILQFFDVATTDRHKNILVRSNNASSETKAAGIRWMNLSAITSIEIFTPSNTYPVGSNFKLIGIVA